MTPGENSETVSMPHNVRRRAPIQCFLVLVLVNLMRDSYDPLTALIPCLETLRSTCEAAKRSKRCRRGCRPLQSPVDRFSAPSRATAALGLTV